ncbi:hypothetical protein, partial [Desertimonas flava]|uniref:hypothetical protein n=1 Tax=Desertimonas flava TaxID=2064846 RepID=UPI001877FCB1
TVDVVDDTGTDDVVVDAGTVVDVTGTVVEVEVDGGSDDTPAGSKSASRTNASSCSTSRNSPESSPATASTDPTPMCPNVRRADGLMAVTVADPCEAVMRAPLAAAAGRKMRSDADSVATELTAPSPAGHTAASNSDGSAPLRVTRREGIDVHDSPDPMVVAGSVVGAAVVVVREVVGVTVLGAAVVGMSATVVAGTVVAAVVGGAVVVVSGTDVAVGADVVGPSVGGGASEVTGTVVGDGDSSSATTGIAPTETSAAASAPNALVRAQSRDIIQAFPVRRATAHLTRPG